MQDIVNACSQCICHIHEEEYHLICMTATSRKTPRPALNFRRFLRAVQVVPKPVSLVLKFSAG